MSSTGPSVVKVIVKKHQLAKVVEESTKSRFERIFVGVGYRRNRLYFVEDMYECPNIADNPVVYFKADPLCIYSVYNNAESTGREVVLLVHSHPAPPYPSRDDYEGMKYWALPWLIISSSTGGYKAWILEEGVLREVVVEGV